MIFLIPFLIFFTLFWIALYKWISYKKEILSEYGISTTWYGKRKDKQ